MKIETSPSLVLDSFTASRSKSYSFSYNSVQKAKQKKYKKPLNVKITHVVCLCPKQQVQQIIQLDLIYTNYVWRNKAN